MGHTVVDVGELPGEGPGGAVRFLRRALGATAFGINHFTLPPGASGREHDELSSTQEEVVLVLEGSGVLRVDDEEVPLRPGIAVRLDPEATRVPVAGPDGLVFVTIGSPRVDPYVARGPF
ncbi:MAG: cupin domain-containing protein [Gaiella sp.]